MKKEIKELKELLIESIDEKVPREKVGLLLSGGLDSSLLALLLKKTNYDFVCYSAEFVYGNFNQAEDIKYAKLLAENLNLNLKIVKVKIEEVEKALPEIIEIIKRKEVPMVSIATAIYFCARQAKEDGIKKIFYDDALDCVFAGLEKHRISKNLKQTCIQSLESSYQNDFPRDSAITKHFGIKLVSPFLNDKLTSFALNLADDFKIKDNINKFILRKTAIELGLPEEIAMRKKRAIQYSSNSQKIIKKISKQKGFDKIKDYLESL